MYEDVNQDECAESSDPVNSPSWAGILADRLESVLVVVAGAAFVIIAALVIVQVFFRYVLAAPPSWTGELTQYVFVWLAWLSSAVVFRRGQHITIDAISGFVPKRLRSTHEFFVNLTCFFVLIFLLRYGMEALKYTTTLSAALQIDMRLVYLSAPVASLFMMAFAVLGPLDSHFQRKNARVG